MCVRVLLLSVTLLIPLCGTALAQDDPPPLKPEELDALTAPIALYPDSLLSQVLMATTYPADVATAAEWSEGHKDQEGDAAVKAVDPEPWDPSVKSLCAFPSVLAMMKADPDWVQKTGDAFLAQSKDVMDSVQRLRKQAKDAGNLKSDEQQVVTEEPAASASSSTTIIIEPADPQVVSVPSYNPTVVYGTWAYPSYPPTYFPPPPGYAFGSALATGFAFATGVAIADSLWGDCDWGGGDIDIDVNQYNNVNIGNKINSDNTQWNHNAANRGGVPYANSSTRSKYAGTTATGADQRADYRGRDATATTAAAGDSTRDAQREAARSNLEKTTGVSTRDATGAGTREAGASSQGNRDGGGAGAREATASNQSSRGGGGSGSALSGVQNSSAERASAQRGSSSAGGRSVSGGGGGSRSGGGGGGGGSRRR